MDKEDNLLDTVVIKNDNLIEAVVVMGYLTFLKYGAILIKQNDIINGWTEYTEKLYDEKSRCKYSRQW